MSFVARHPRYSLLVLCILLVSSFLLIQDRSPSFPRPSELLKSGSNLKERLKESEWFFQESLKDRQGLIKKWGPRIDQVKPFPDKFESYTLWDFFIPSYQCPHRVSRIGALGDGGKWVCGFERLVKQHKPCVIYSFGINGESSFEAALLSAAPHCEVWGYDFTVTKFGPEVDNEPGLRSRAHFSPYALGGKDIPHNDPPTYTLQSLMKMNGHDFIDVLKIDIEGAEFNSLTSFLDAFNIPTDVDIYHPHGSASEPVLPIGQLQLELHAWDDYGASFPFFKGWWERLEYAGLRPFWTEPNMVYVNNARGVKPELVEYSYMNIRGNHALVNEAY